MHEPPAREAIKYDLPCPRCGYNLRGLDSDNLCPECGQAIYHAMQGNLLRFADPKWVRYLSYGVNCEIACLLILPPALIIELYFPTSNSVPVWLVLLIAVGRLLFATACFLITMPDPAVARNPAVEHLIAAVRILAVIGFFGGVSWDVAQSSFGAIFSERLSIVASLAMIPVFLGKITVLWGLARRLRVWDIGERLANFSYFSSICILGTFGIASGLLCVVLALNYLTLGTLLIAGIFWLIYYSALTELKRAIEFDLEDAERYEPNTSVQSGE